MNQLTNFYNRFRGIISHYLPSRTSSPVSPNFALPNPSVSTVGISLDSTMKLPAEEEQLEERTSANSSSSVVEAADTSTRLDNFDWSMLFMVFSLTSGVEIALFSLQGKSHSHIKSLQLLSFSILLAFASLLVAKFIKCNYPVQSEALERAGILFATAAFCLAMTIPFPFYLKACSWGVYVFSLFTIAICNRA